MVVEYFIKWVEVEALSTITEKRVIDSVWKNIISRFGIQRILVADNGAQFSGHKMREWCHDLKIEQRFTSVGYPQANGQTEATNKTIVATCKKDSQKKEKDGLNN